MDYNLFLTKLAEEFVAEGQTEDLIASFAGGSVGRNEADQYSDLDLNYYVEGNREYSQNIEFYEHHIQLHVHQLPTIKDVHSSPWDYRFLQEAKIITDTNGVLKTLKSEAIDFFRSPEAITIMKNEAKETIDQRLSWLDACISDNSYISAGFAANAAWTDAAFAYIYFVHGEVATGKLLSYMRELPLFEEYRVISLAHKSNNPDKLLQSLKSYRSYLNKKNANSFELNPVQNKLIEAKTARNDEAGNIDEIAWEINAEAFWCYLASSNGKAVEEHLVELPLEIVQLMPTLGVVPYTKEQLGLLRHQVQAICTFWLED